ncbi:MAG TPA: hypothetical protein VMF88_10460 [Bacteroidota bacterium]|nr:hypothetical protein [Bacteroidota bacterium]
MNIQKLYDALDADEMNSSLGIICAELESQGYAVMINDGEVRSEEFFDGEHKDLEQEFIPIKMSLYRAENFEQQFVIEFTEYHDFVIKKCDTQSSA